MSSPVVKPINDDDVSFHGHEQRRKGFPPETGVKRGDRVVGGAKDLVEKLGRNDPYPCGSARSFKRCGLRSGCY